MLILLRRKSRPERTVVIDDVVALAMNGRDILMTRSLLEQFNGKERCWFYIVFLGVFLAVHLALGVWCLLNGVSALPLLLTFVPLVMFFIMALYALRREKEEERGETWYLEIGKPIKRSESVKGRRGECSGKGVGQDKRTKERG